MKLTSLFKDDEAVSPVIGVILMVAITVILAAVIGAFVLGIGGSQTQTPQASWEWESATSGSSDNHYSGSDVTNCGSSGTTHAKVTHQGGDEIDAQNLELGGSSCASNEVLITAGDSLAKNDASSGQISLVWSSPSSDDTSILSSFEI